MQNTYSSLQAECAAAGITLQQACRRADVNEAVVRRWKQKEPKTLQTLALVRKVIEDAKRNNEKGKKPAV